MIHSGKTEDGIPRFYAAIENKEIMGTYALIRNDLNSRQDLHPWLACLYVDPNSRGKKLGARLLDHTIEEAAKLGFNKLYLQTDLEGYYENTAGRIAERYTGRAAAPLSYMKRIQTHLRIKTKRPGIS